MTRPQYIALCIIGAVAGLAYIQSYQLSKALQNMAGGSVRGKASPLTV